VPNQQEQQAMADLFARHMGAEFAGDLETTLATMTDNPHLVNVPSMVGGAGREGVRAFYADHLVGKFLPPDVEFTEVSRTFGDRQLVDELVVSFTHTQVGVAVVPGVLLDHVGVYPAQRHGAATAVARLIYSRLPGSATASRAGSGAAALSAGRGAAARRR
jgi:hypothetical protein